MEYSTDNIFYKIIHKEIETKPVLEGDTYIAINDIKPKAPIHILVIPKGNYITYGDFLNKATDFEILDFNRGIEKIISLMKLDIGGYQLVSNAGAFGKQEVPHMHVHILGKQN